MLANTRQCLNVSKLLLCALRVHPPVHALQLTTTNHHPNTSAGHGGRSKAQAGDELMAHNQLPRRLQLLLGNFYSGSGSSRGVTNHVAWDAAMQCAMQHCGWQRPPFRGPSRSKAFA